MKQNLTKVKEEMDKSLIIVGDANNHPSKINSQKIKRMWKNSTILTNRL